MVAAVAGRGSAPATRTAGHHHESRWVQSFVDGEHAGENIAAPNKTDSEYRANCRLMKIDKKSGN